MILLIEDDDDIRESFAAYLTQESFAVITADCGICGLKAAREFKPGLIICDFLMPGMDGLDVFMALKQNKSTCDIPFIFSGSKSERTDSNRAKEPGAKYFLLKPFAEDELLKYISNCLKR